MGLEGEEEGPGHLQPPGGALGSDHLKHHLPTVSADIELGSQHSLSSSHHWVTHWQGGRARRGRSVLRGNWGWVSPPSRGRGGGG